MASCEELLQSIQPNMRLTKSFIKRIYGYGVTDVSFPDKAIGALEAAGCSKVRQYYVSWTNEYKAARDAELKEVARWYRKECDKQWEQKRGEIRRKREQENLQQMSSGDLIILLESLIGVT